MVHEARLSAESQTRDLPENFDTAQVCLLTRHTAQKGPTTHARNIRIYLSTRPWGFL